MVLKRISLLILFMYSSVCWGKEVTLFEVRTLFLKAETEESSCQELIQILTPYNEQNNPLFLGYKGIATIIMAKHIGNPITKLSNFKRGRNMLEKAITADQYNAELRYLRFAVQTNIPSFLGYNKNIQNDKEFLYRNASNIKDKDLKLHILDYLKYVAKHNKY